MPPDDDSPDAHLILAGQVREHVARDRINLIKLDELGWEAMIVWECETTDVETLTPHLVEFLD